MADGTDGQLRLPGGRTVVYATYGDPDGAVVLSCHGGLMSHHDAAPADTAARERGVRIVSPARPGVAGSDRRPDSTMLDWVRDDVTALLDHLGVDRCSVTGWSEGGQYALACAAGLADRVAAVAVVAGCPPLDQPATFAELNRTDRRLATLSRRAPVVARGQLRAMRAVARRSPRRLAAISARSMGGDAAAVLAGREQWFATTMAEGLSDLHGAVDEYLRFVAPWGFAPGDLGLPVQIHQGTADGLVPTAWGRRLAEDIPGATLTTYDGEGHLVGLTHADDILEALVRAGEGG